jgi:uncharacterized protein YjiS (DUF1127 family)
MSATTLATRSTGHGTGRAGLSRMMAALGRWYLERRTMAALARLDPHLLHDIGLSSVPGLEEVRRRLAGR